MNNNRASGYPALSTGLTEKVVSEEMKKLVLSMSTLAVLPAGALQAQNMAGRWQGTLQAAPGRQLRIVIKIALDDDKLKAVLYSIDQPGPGIPASAITKNGSAIKMTIAALNGNYEGRMSADGNSIAGTGKVVGQEVELDHAGLLPSLRSYLCTSCAVTRGKTCSGRMAQRGSLLDYLEQVRRRGFRARDLQLRHGRSLEELAAGDREPAGPGAGPVPARAIGGYAGAGVHLAV
jgi:hypothetical protein